MHAVPLRVMAPDTYVEQLRGRIDDVAVLHPWSTDQAPPELDLVVLPPAPEPADLAWLRQRDDVRVVQLSSAGYDGILAYLPPKATLCNARGVHDPSVAEWVVLALLAAFRDLPRIVSDQHAHDWRARPSRTLFGKRVLVLGHGSIGQQLETMLDGFAVTTIGVARTARPGVHGVDSLDDLAEQCDALVVLLPASPETDQLVGEAVLSRLPIDAVLVNAGRGSVVDEEALLRHLEAGRLRAVLDVTTEEPLPAAHPLWSAPNCLITSHNAGNTDIRVPRTLDLIEQQIRSWTTSGLLANVVREPTRA